MKKIFFTVLTVTITLISIMNSRAQSSILERDPKITAMVSGVSAANLEKYVRNMVGFKTRHTLSTRNEKEKGIGAACNYVKSEFEKNIFAAEGRLIVNLDTLILEPDGRRVTRKTVLTNVVAILKGSDPEDKRVLIVGGHLDSRNGEANDSVGTAPGANDDASGVAAVIELLRVMSPQKFPCTIVFVAFSGEEQGLNGSTFLAKKAKEENWNVLAMLNNDMIGNTFSNETLLKDNLHVRVFSETIPASESDAAKILRQSTNADNDSPSRQLARYVKETGENYVDQIEVKLIYRNDRFLRGGDHTPFNKQGFTAVRFCEMNENYDYQHQNVREEKGVKYGDLPEFVDYEYARKIAAINASVLSSLSLAPQQPSSVGIVVSGLGNSTTLKWKTPAGKIPKGYFILMRETFQPVWKKKFFTDKNEITLPYSKDNFFFAVQSVDDEGHLSLASWPSPIR